MDQATGPLVEIAVRAKTRIGQSVLDQALARLAAEPSPASVIIDRQDDDIVIKGTGEADLEFVVEHLVREANVDLDVGAPRVCYRETITRRTEISRTYKKLTDASGAYAHVKLRFQPTVPEEGYAFESAIMGGVLPREYIAAVASGLDKARATGVLAGWPVIGLRVTLTDGAYHDVDSTPAAFETAGGGAFREGMMKAAPRLLEPVMTVEVATPAGLLRDIVRDLKQRRGDIVALGGSGDARTITATVPLAGMLGYAGAIASQSQGRVRLVLRFSHYAPTPVPPPDDPSFRPAGAMRA